MKSGYLAPTLRQRLGYIDWLHVYAKDRSRLPNRMAYLVDDYVVSDLCSHNVRRIEHSCGKTQLKVLSALPSPWVRYETPSLYDVFEPTLISTALSLHHNLGHLIYGADLWITLGGVRSDTTDPITCFFRDQGLLSIPHMHCTNSS